MENVYKAYDFASPIAYNVEPVTIGRSSITKDLKHDQLTERGEQNIHILRLFWSSP